MDKLIFILLITLMVIGCQEKQKTIKCPPTADTSEFERYENCLAYGISENKDVEYFAKRKVCVNFDIDGKYGVIPSRIWSN